MRQSDCWRTYRDFQTLLDATPEEIFALLCPIREYDWIPHWRCELLYSRSGIAEAGCVFATDFGDQYGRETWVVSCYEPNRRIAFVRTGMLRSMRYKFDLFPRDNGTLLQARQEITGLSAEGNALVANSSTADFQTQMEGLMTMLRHYLQTKTMLPPAGR